MKNSCFTPTFLLLPLTSFCQPVLNTGNAFSVGTTIDLYVDTAPVLDEGNTGSGQAWNFISLYDANLPDEYVGVSKASTPYGNDFPQASFATQSYDFLGDLIYNYYTNSATGYQYYGYENSSSRIVFSDPMEILHFPFTFQDQFADHYSGVTGDTGVNYGTVQEFADAYGTLEMPSGLFYNCLRVREVRQDTLITPVFGQSYSNDTSYKFYTVNYPEPVCQVNYHHSLLDGSPFDFNEIYWQSLLPSSVVEEESASAIYFYPNPCSDFITVRNPDFARSSSIKILNMLGESIDAAVIKSGNELRINTSALTDGLYYLYVEDLKETRSFPFIKISMH